MPIRHGASPSPRSAAILRLWLAGLSLALISLAWSPATALGSTTYYVSTAGNNSNPGTYARPWRTLQKAANVAPAGSRILIRAGTYAAVTISRPSLTFARYASEKVIVNASATRPNAIVISNTRNITIRGLIAQKGPSTWGAGIRVDRARNVTIRGSVMRNNRSFGLMIQSSTNVAVRNNKIYKNETGIQISYLGAGVDIVNNVIRDNDRMIINDSAPGNDRGANAIVFYKTDGPIRVLRNRIYGHRAPSHDWGHDGGAFEIYAASGITIAQNRLYNNQNVVETGTDGTRPCRDIRFVRNVAVGGAKSGVKAEGLILRCMSNSLVANNTFADLTDFVYYLTQSGGFVGSIGGLVIQNNIARQKSAKVYSLQGIPSGVTINHNLAFSSTGSSIAWVNGKGNTTSLATFRSWTGFEKSGVQANPRFRDGPNYDYRLRSTSPAIDRGVVIAGVTGGFRGRAPDLGRFEY